MVQKIYIARHGFRLNWLTTNWDSVTGLPRDPPLAAFGETQAKELAAYFLALPENERPTAIFSSPYYRCLQTSKPISTALGLPIFVEHGIAEWYSPVTPGTGLHPRPAPAHTLKTFVPEIDTAWAPMWLPPRTGEDVRAVHARAAAFLAAFLPALQRSRRAPTRILLVTHAATAIALVRALLGAPALPLRVGCCSLSELVRPTGGAVLGGWEARRLADGAHLTGGASRDWGFEDVEIDAGKVVEDPGVPGTELEDDGPSGLSVQYQSSL